MHYGKQLIQLVVQNIEEPNPKKICVLHAMIVVLLTQSVVAKTKIKKKCFIKAGFEHQQSDDNDHDDINNDDNTIRVEIPVMNTWTAMRIQ